MIIHTCASVSSTHFSIECFIVFLEMQSTRPFILCTIPLGLRTSISYLSHAIWEPSIPALTQNARRIHALLIMAGRRPRSLTREYHSTQDQLYTWLKLRIAYSKPVAGMRFVVNFDYKKRSEYLIHCSPSDMDRLRLRTRNVLKYLLARSLKRCKQRMLRILPYYWFTMKS